MKKKSLTARVLDKVEKSNDNGFTYVSVRLEPEIYYMLDLISFLSKSNVSTVLMDEISEILLELIVNELSIRDESQQQELLNELPYSLLKKLAELDIAVENRSYLISKRNKLFSS